MRRTAVILTAGAVALAAVVAASPTVDERYWPQWRGPLMTGVAPLADPPVEWSEDTNVAWKVEIPGRGHGTPVIWEDRVFVLTAIPQGDDAVAAVPAGTAVPAGALTQRPRGRGRGQSGPEPVHEFVIMALDRADGSVVWQQTAGVERPHQGKRDNNTYASASAITDGEHVVAFYGSRGLYVYDMEGNLQWQADLGDMEIRNAFGEGATPALHGDTLVVTWDHQGPSFIVAFDKATGEERWRRDRDEIDTWATPLVVDEGGRTQVVTVGTERVRSYDLQSGELIWEGDGLTMNPIPSPVFSDGVVFLTSGYRGNALRAVRLSEASGDVTGTGAVLWEYNQDTPYVPSPLLYGDNFYMLKSNNAILTNIDATTGEPHYGPVRLEGLSEVYASPVGASGRVYIVGRDGAAVVLANGPELEVLATNSLDDGFDASPAVVGNEMYLRGYRYLYRISEE